MVDFKPYKCISNKQENGVSESSEYICFQQTVRVVFNYVVTEYRGLRKQVTAS